MNTTEKRFPSLEARILSSYLDTLPDFVPKTDAPATREEQARFYAFVKGVYARAAESPAIFFLKTQPDDAHPNRFHKSSYGKPALATNIRKIAAAVDGFFTFLAEAGEAGTADADSLTLPEAFRIPTKHRKSMEAFGLTCAENVISSKKWPGMFRAWKMLCAPCADELDTRRRVARMEKCAFVENTPGLKGAFHRLMGEDAAALICWLEAHGYVRENLILNKEITALRYLKDGSGVQFLYDYQAETPAYMALIQTGWRELLPGFGKMRPSLQSFIVRHNKICDNCGYCTQRAKGKGKLYAVPVEYEGETLNLCPLFPGYSYVFTELDPQAVTGTIECLRYMQSAPAQKKDPETADNIRMFRI